MRRDKVIIALIALVVVTGSLLMATTCEVHPEVQGGEEDHGPIPTITPVPGRIYEPPCTAPGKSCILIR